MNWLKRVKSDDIRTSDPILVLSFGMHCHTGRSCINVTHYLCGKEQIGKYIETIGPKKMKGQCNACFGNGKF